MRDVSDGHLELRRVLPPQQAHQLADWWRGLHLLDWRGVTGSSAVYWSRRLQRQRHLAGGQEADMESGEGEELCLKVDAK